MIGKEHGFAGEYIVQADLISKGFTPFATNVSSSEVDVIALKDNFTYRIQVKTSICTETGTLKMDIRKSNRKYGNYTKNSFDILAVVDIEKSKVAYFKWKDIFPRTKLTLRTNTYSKDMNNHGSGDIWQFEDYLEFPIGNKIKRAI